MQVWLLIDGTKEGPFHDFEVRSKITHDDLPADTMAWYESMDSWKPLGEIGLFEDSFNEKKDAIDSLEDEDLEDDSSEPAATEVNRPKVVNAENVEEYIEELRRTEIANRPPRKHTPEGIPIPSLYDGVVGVHLWRRLAARSFDFLATSVFIFLGLVFNNADF